MPRAEDKQTLVRAVVSPRFEVFYALQNLELGAGHDLLEWRREMEHRLPARLRTSLANVAPMPLMWPLLADSLRESAAAITFGEMIDALRKMDERSFQSFVLEGVFKTKGSVERLVSGTSSLARIVEAEAGSQEKMLALLGLNPFNRNAPSVMAFERLVTTPGDYRNEVVNVLESFWSSGFSDTWEELEPILREQAKEMRARVTRGSFAEYALEHKLPVTMKDGAVVTVRGSTRTTVRSVNGIYLLPSKFNTARLWAAYTDARGRTRFFLPVVEAGRTPVPTDVAAIDPALVFRALGDTTRFAMAATIARTPMTSVELARAFGVSKPTISHHVRVLRAAGLLDEVHTESGVQLSLDRRVLERLSDETTRKLFSDDDATPLVKRSRRPKK